MKPNERRKNFINNDILEYIVGNLFFPFNSSTTKLTSKLGTLKGFYHYVNDFTFSFESNKRKLGNSFNVYVMEFYF